MSVITITHLRGDVDKMKAVLAGGAETMEQVSAAAREAGALSHRFVVGDGELLVLDEWTSAQAHADFFSSNEGIRSLLGAAGLTAPPSTDVFETLEAAGTF